MAKSKKKTEPEKKRRRPSAKKWIEKAPETLVDLLEKTPGPVLIWGRPEKREIDFATFHVWRTLDNRYMAARVVSKLSGEARFNAYQTTETIQAFGGGTKWHDVPLRVQENGRPKDYGSLFRTMEVVREHYAESLQLADVRSNEADVLSHAVAEGLAELPSSVVVKKSTPRPETSSSRTSGDEPQGVATEKASPRPPRAKAAASGPVDAFGSREGSLEAKCNAVLSKTPKKMKQLVQEGGLSDTCYDHLKKLATRGLVEKTPDGYRLK